MAITSPSIRMWGRFEHSLDDKGRVIVPQKFRDKLGEEFVLITGPDHHLRVLPMSVWEELEAQLIGNGIQDEEDASLNFLKRLYGNCEFTGIDQQHRLSIPRHMRVWAGLEEGEIAIIIGGGTRLEIWSRANWEAYSKKFTEDNAAKASTDRNFVEGPRNARSQSPNNGTVDTNSVPPAA